MHYELMRSVLFFMNFIKLIWFQQQTIRAEVFPSLRSRDVNIVWQLMCCACFIWKAHTGMYNSVSGRTTFHGASVIFAEAEIFFQIIPASAAVTRRSQASVSADI